MINKINEGLTGERFIPVDDEEFTVLEMIYRILSKCGEIIDKTNILDELTELLKKNKVSYDDMEKIYKLSKSANFTGSWFGIKEPTFSEPGIAGVVDLNRHNIERKYFNVQTFGAIGDGVTDDTQAFQDTINYVKENGGRVFVPKGIYYINGNLDLKGVSIEGVYVSHFSMVGTILKGNGSNIILEQKSAGASDLSYNIKYLKIIDGNIGIKTTYTVNSIFEELYIENCDTGFCFGDNNVYGGLFNTFQNVYVNKCQYGLQINGKTWANNNTFNNCYFFGYKVGCKCNCDGGLGGINNTFNCCEFKSDRKETKLKLGGRGIELSRFPNTNFNNCYFENHSCACYVDLISSATFNNCVFGSICNNNVNKDNAFIIGSDTSSNIIINGGYLAFSGSDDQQNIMFVTQEVDKLTIINEPRIANKPNGFKLTDNNYYNNINSSALNVITDKAQKLVMKNTDETEGFEITRNKGAGGSDYGVLFKLLSETYLQLIDGKINVEKELNTNKLNVNSDLQIKGSANGIILQSTGGKIFKVQIGDDGSLIINEQ